jgi:hypothetical protein
VHTLLLVVCGVLVVKFFVVAFWMQDQTYQRAARLNLVAALLCVGAGAVGLAGFELAGVVAAVVALVLGISSFHLVRVGRG